MVPPAAAQIPSIETTVFGQPAQLPSRSSAPPFRGPLTVWTVGSGKPRRPECHLSACSNEISSQPTKVATMKTRSSLPLARAR